MSALYWLLSHEALQVRMVRSIREARTPLMPWVPKVRAAGELPAPLTVSGKTATIRVEGVLTPTPDMMAELYGEPNTTYADLQDSLSAAIGDPKVREIVWSIDSPGGSVDGLFALLDQIENAKTSGKQMRVEATNAHSAAYGIAAAAGPITATSRMSSIGSVGVATSGFIQGGICGTVVDLTNSDAPDKRPDLAKPEGRAVVVAYLDQLAEQFMGSIARGRGTDAETVRQSYGRGASMLAEAARDAGIIDDIRDPRARARTDLTNVQTPDTVAGDMADQKPPVPAPAAVVQEPAPVPVVAVVAVPSITDAERAEFAAFRAERDARVTTERRELITALVVLGAETPATAWVNDAPAPRLAAEPLSDLRARVEALRASKPKSPELRPPASAAGEGALSEVEQSYAATIKDPERRERFVARRLERKQKAQ